MKAQDKSSGEDQSHTDFKGNQDETRGDITRHLFSTRWCLDDGLAQVALGISACEGGFWLEVKAIDSLTHNFFSKNIWFDFELSSQI